MGALWPEMLPELLQKISDRLPVLDFIAFRQVCRAWRSAPSGRSEITNFDKQTPWLMFYNIHNIGTNNCYIYSQSYAKCCIFNLPDLQGSTIVHSKSDWLLAHRGQCLFLFNPFSLEKIILPKHSGSDIQAGTFTVTGAKTVFIVNRTDESVLKLGVCRAGDEEWATHTLCEGWVDGGMLGVACGSNNMICIHNKHEGMIYDWGAKRRASRFRLGFGNGRSNASRWYEELEMLHKQDWLCKFGKRGVVISGCDLRKFGMGESFYGCNADEMAKSGDFMALKAAWIEPRISKKLPEEEAM